jgi:nucleoside-diphosphate-sugar epimerase
MSKHLFCFGLGYSALTLAKQLLGQGWRVSGTCRSSEKCEQLRKEGITAYIFDNDLPLQEIWDLQSVTHILHSIAPSEDGDAVILNHFMDLQSLANLEWLGYLSTTGVYGDYKGEWVDEDTKTTPPEGRSQRRVDAEGAWLQSGLPVHIFRLSGIYGKERNSIKDLKAGKAHRIYKENQVFSRIHVEDIAQILQASIAKPNIGRIYNCADNEPTAQSNVVEYAAQLLGVTPPSLVNYEDAELSQMARSFWKNNRRVKNERIKNELEVTLKYPTYREGLEGCL